MMETLQELLRDERVVRELGNGTWSILSIEILLAVNLYLWRSWRNRADVDLPFLQRLPIRMAFAIDIYMIGSGLRAWWVWMLLECQNRTMAGCAHIQSSYIVMHMAVLFAVVGGLCLVRLMTLHWGRKGWIAWAFGGLLAAAIPIVVHIVV